MFGCGGSTTARQRKLSWPSNEPVGRGVSPPQGSEQLVCPSCGRSYDAGERFCADCGIPLTHHEQSEPGALVSERHRRARKVKPQLAEGKLVRVAGARNQAEAEFIQDLLLQQGVPSMLRRSAGFDVPDFLAAGPRDVLVPESGVMTAREVLLEAELISTEPAGPVVSPRHLLIGLLAALAVGALIVWAITRLLS
jgi:ribosomal protein L37E